MRSIQEIQVPETEPQPTYVTQVMVISPEHAERLGIVGVEAPVFVGTNDNKIECCEGCQESYPPSIYQVGHVVRRPHDGCSSGNGGVYFDEWSILKKEIVYMVAGNLIPILGLLQLSHLER